MQNFIRKHFSPFCRHWTWIRSDTFHAFACACNDAYCTDNIQNKTKHSWQYLLQPMYASHPKAVFWEWSREFFSCPPTQTLKLWWHVHPPPPSPPSCAKFRCKHPSHLFRNSLHPVAIMRSFFVLFCSCWVCQWGSSIIGFGLWTVPRRNPVFVPHVVVWRSKSSGYPGWVRDLY